MVDTARVHLRVLGQERDLSFPVHVGPCATTDLLLAARGLSRAVIALSVEQANAEGREVSCREGCTACCRQLVGVTSIEAVALADLVAALPPDRQAAVRKRFSTAVEQIERMGLLGATAAEGGSVQMSRTAAGDLVWDGVRRQYFDAQIDCPFLEDDRCSVYDERPLTCREYNVTTPAAWCTTLSDDVRAIERPVRTAQGVLGAAREIAGTPDTLIPLPLLLEWVEAHGGALRGTFDGEAMFWVMLRKLDTECGTPFDERPDGSAAPEG